MKWKFWIPKDEYDIHCERFIKYNGTKIDLSGLGFDIVELGKIGIEPTLLQAVSQALMLLDFSQYRLCKAVSNAPDKETRKRNYDLMVADITRSNVVCDAIASLSLNPGSKELQNALKDILLSRVSRSEGRVIEIEKSSPHPELISDNGVVEEKSIDVGQSGLSVKLEQLKQSYPQLSEKESSPVTKEFSQDKYLKIKRILSNLMSERGNYEDSGEIVEMYKNISPDLRDLYKDKKLMGNRDATHLKAISIRLGQEVQEYKPLEGTNVKNENDLKIKIILTVEEIIELVDNKFIQLSDLLVKEIS